MAVVNTATTDTIAQWLTDFNTLAAFIGDITALNSNITDNTNPDTIVTALNYLYTLASTEDTTITGALTLESTLIVQDTSNFQGNATFDGSLTFNDTGSAAVTIILDEDNMASDSATALATQQSIKAYVDALSGTINADTVDGIEAASFLRADATDSIASNITTTFGSGSGAIRITHVSADNTTYFRPNIGSAGFSTSYEFGFNGNTDTWFFDNAMSVNGNFTSRGIDDNSTLNVLQLENASISLKQPTTVTGDFTVSSGDITLSNAEDVLVTNGAGEYIEFDGSTVNGLNLYAASLKGVGITASEVTLGFAGSTKLATTNTGVSITGDVVVSDDIFGPSAFDITNQTGEEINFTASGIDLKVSTASVLTLTPATASITGTLAVSSTLNAGATTLSGNLTLPNTGVIDNASTEKLRFTTTGVFLEVGDADILECSATGVNVTGDLTASGTITGTLGDVTLGNITTGTISSGAITSSGTLTITDGDIILPSSTSAADIGNNAGELIRFDGVSNETEIRAGGNIGILVDGNAEVDIRYNNLTKLQTTSSGISVTGAVTATGDGTFNTSDSRLKNLLNHWKLDKAALSTVECLIPRAFTWNEKSKELDPSIDTNNIRLGLIADEVEMIIPEVMGPSTPSPIDGTMYKTVNYSAIVPLLINAIKELSEKVRRLEDE